jgi:hypothetical protein
MADVLHRTTKELRFSVNTPDYSEEEWIVNPDLSALTEVPVEYWKIDSDSVSEMTQEEKDAWDAGASARATAATAAAAIIAEQVQIALATKKREAGASISDNLVDLMGARNKILGLSGSQVTSMLQALSPVKALLETGALSTARYYMGILKAGYSSHADIFDVGIADVNKFEQEFGL